MPHPHSTQAVPAFRGEQNCRDFGGGQNIICGCNSKHSKNGYIGVCMYCGGVRFFAQDLSGFSSEMMPQNPGSDINPYYGHHVAVIIDGKVVTI